MQILWVNLQGKGGKRDSQYLGSPLPNLVRHMIPSIKVEEISKTDATAIIRKNAHSTNVHLKVLAINIAAHPAR